MSEGDVSVILRALGNVEGKVESVQEGMSSMSADIKDVRAYSFAIKSSLDGRITDANRRIDDEKHAREAIEADIREAKRDFVEALNAHAESDRSLSEKIDTLIGGRSEERKTWLGRAWSVAKYVLLLAGAWLSAKLGVTPPSL